MGENTKAIWAIEKKFKNTHWWKHLAAMDCLRQSVKLRGYAQKNPTQEYKRESLITNLPQTLGNSWFQFIYIHTFIQPFL
jgi:hypothetical protein